MLDVSASYPNGQSVFNLSKETTHKEMCSIRGVPEAIQRSAGINLSGGQTNAIEVCTDLFGMPQLTELLKMFETEQAEHLEQIVT